ncbi:heterokaryon incompatibility protein-domain-containing protein [Clohesyomyces aquaticus]|uniref:Heterokaryon incompatibility protein-domain-containing protein n=1 Tax=Clohesyomyces aquaticus TaxID=1231657 RepID=A0A1Y2A5P3_9PLEO|nr:heterokaryon incompatibility protein-domain-containing protein [Clohesyomyces aquaticus]
MATSTSISDNDNICARCTKVPWLDLARSKSGPSAPKISIIETHATLRDSSCRVCRLLALIKPPSLDDNVELVATESLDTRLDGILKFRPGLSLSMGIGVSHQELSKFDNIPLSSPSATINFDIVERWMEICRNDHRDDCKPGSAIRKPSRPVRDLRQALTRDLLVPPPQSSSETLQNLKVIDCHKRRVVSAPKNCQYVALSYVWGQLPLQGSRSISLNELPRTIEDSMQVVCKLGFRYLWVDRYCIDQDDASDKHAQIQQMGHIYSSAQLTLVAAAGSDPTYGLPGVSLRSQPQSHVRVGGITLSYCPLSAAASLQSSTWATRGWTYQEAYLSKRRLIFTDHRALFVCNETIFVEPMNGFPFGSLKHIERLIPRPTLSKSWDSTPAVWATGTRASSELSHVSNCVAEYSKRQLSFESDAFNAILGVLQSLAMREESPIKHVWGVPVEVLTLPFGCSRIALSWYHERPCRRRVEFPSWSSLGWAGPISHYMFSFTPTRNCDIQLQDGSGTRTPLRNIADKSKEENTSDIEIPRGLVLTAPAIELVFTNSELIASKELENIASTIPSSHVVLPLSTCSKDGPKGPAGKKSAWRCRAFPVQWDRDNEHLISDRPCEGLVILNNLENLDGLGELLILVVRPLGESYERVGICRLECQQIGAAEIRGTKKKTITLV